MKKTFMVAKTRYPFRETYDRRLCVLPTEGESQYEAFQSIFTLIMAGKPYVPEPPEPILPYPETPYQILCRNATPPILLSEGDAPRHPSNTKRYIYYYPQDETGSTHYRAIRQGKKLDPYHLYQSKDTQGYCQMFAYFLAIDEVDEFKMVDQRKPIDTDNFERLVYNNKVCLGKALVALERDPEAMASFTEYFTRWYGKKNALVEGWRKKAGIKPDTTTEDYLSDYKWMNDQTDFVRAYVYEQPLVGYLDDEPMTQRPSLWFLENEPVPDDAVDELFTERVAVETKTQRMSKGLSHSGTRRKSRKNKVKRLFLYRK